MHEFNIRVFRAIYDEESCRLFINGHTKVLIDYGVTMITSSKPTWLTDPNVYCVVAEIPGTKNIVGGVRVHISDGESPLPLEEAIGKLDPTIYKIVNSYIEDGVGEICGLWNSKEVSGLGLSVVLTRAGITIVEQLHFQSLMTICADFTLNMCINLGFLINNSLGDGGKFPYPTDEYITRVLGIMNAQSLEAAAIYDKEMMMTLRNDLTQTRIEKEKEKEFLVYYNLKLAKSSLKTPSITDHTQLKN